MHALIIEDDALIAMAIEDILRGCGLTSIDVAVSFDEAVAAAAERRPTLITADVELGPGCGINAVQAISLESWIPAIFITGRAEAARSRMPLYQVISKPFRVSDVQAAVRQSLIH
jgi:two-component system, response regulator PdtaR